MTVEEIICSEIIATGSNKLELQTIIDAIEANNRSKNTQVAYYWGVQVEAFAPIAIGVSQESTKGFLFINIIKGVHFVVFYFSV